jgi:Zn-dependent M28 family amino/carboxypeptidase
MGTIVYAGIFRPMFYRDNEFSYQNYTVDIPKDITKGEAQLNVAHFPLLGVHYPKLCSGTY